MARPGGEMAAGAGGGSRPRPAHAGREQVIDALQAAYVQGRLDKDEFELRVSKVLASYAELDALTADIPAGLTEGPAPQPARESHNKKVIQRGTAAGAGASMAVAAAAVTAAGGGAVGLLVVPVIGLCVAVLLAGLMTLLSWVLERGSGGQPAPGPPPGAGGQPADRPARADPAGPRRPTRPRRPAELARHRGGELARRSGIHRPRAGGLARVI